ncbi:MAG: hypothetical protein ACHQ9S_27110 [Candidatus Binatia bacterium]
MRQPVDIHSEPLAYLRGCGFIVVLNETVIQLAPTVPMSAAVQQKALRYAKRHRDQLLADLSEEAALGRLRGRGL